MKRTSSENIVMGKRLKELRTLRGLTVQEVADAVEVASSTWREWENGRAITGLPYIKMANIFRVSLHEIFGMSHPKKEIEANLRKIEDLIQSIYLNL